MNSKSNVVIIGIGPSLKDINTVDKKLSEATVICNQRIKQGFESLNIGIKELGTSSEDLKKSFENIGISLNDLKAKVIYEPKSKYFNNPRYNFKNKSTPQKRNNRNHYRK